MSMPPPRCLILAVGCVVKCTKVAGLTTITIARTVADIQNLDHYFVTPSTSLLGKTLAHEIVAKKAGFGVVTKHDVDANISSKALKHSSSLKVYSLPAKKRGKSRRVQPGGTAGAVDMKEGYCYWLA